MTRRSGTTDPAPAAPRPREAPDRVPGYRDLRRIGHGGFGVVYRAVQEAFDRAVAVKVLTVVGPDEDARRRFVREVRLAGRLSGHPHVVTVLDTGTTASGRPFLAMELYDGGSMKERLARRGPLGPAAAAAVGAKIADALAAAHALGVLHRDVKPNNILISRYGEPALADFGVSCLIDAESSSSVLDVFSPQHAAPELMTRGAPTVSSDVYALGSTLYELVTGRSPFGRPGQEVLATMYRTVHDPVPRLECPSLPGLADVVERAMAKDPADRFPDAASFGRALRALIPESAMVPAGEPGSGTSTDTVTVSGRRPGPGRGRFSRDAAPAGQPIAEGATLRADDTMLRPDRAVPERIAPVSSGAGGSRHGSGPRRGGHGGHGGRGAAGDSGPDRKMMVLGAVVLLVVVAGAVVAMQGPASPRPDAGQVTVLAPTTASSGPAVPRASSAPPPTRPSSSAPSKPRHTATSSAPSAPVSSSVASSGPPLIGTFHRLQNAGSGSCLAQPAGSGSAVVQGCADSRFEGWRYSGLLGGLLGAVTGQVELVNGLSGGCLTAAGGGRVTVGPCTGNEAQTWSKTGGDGASTEFQNAADGQCLQAAQGAVSTGPCTSGGPDLWAEDGTV